MAENIDLRFLGASLTKIDGKLEAFRESVDDRFDQQVELLKTSFRSLSAEIQSIKNK